MSPGDDLAAPQGAYRHSVAGQLQFVLVVLLCGVWLPTLLRSDDVSLLIKIVMVFAATGALIWGGIQTLLPPVVVNTTGVQVRPRTRLTSEQFLWEDLGGYCQNSLTDRQLALLARSDRIIALPELKEQSDLERQLAKRLSLLPDPRIPQAP